MCSGDGSKEMFGVALTVAGDGDAGAVLDVPPLHAARRVRQIREERRSMFVSE
jgi:hypothetical protein